MKHTHTTIAVMALFLTAPATWGMSNNQLKEITFEEYVEPRFPYDLVFDGVVEGNVSIAVDINEDGTVADWLPLSSSNEKLTREIDRVIDRWIFKPLVQDGVAKPVIYEIQFHFSHQGVTFSGGNLTALFLNQITSRNTDNRLVYNLSELDKIPAPVDLVHPQHVLDAEGGKLSGEVLIEFFIDPEGNVRLPVVRELNGPIDLAQSAFQAISDWKFEPPIRAGKPVTARARQPFVFSGSNK